VALIGCGAGAGGGGGGGTAKLSDAVGGAADVTPTDDQNSMADDFSTGDAADADTCSAVNDPPCPCCARS